MNFQAYYPSKNGGKHTYIGGGFLAEEYIPKYSSTNFTFPFALEYNPTYDTDQSVLNNLAEKCGLTGGPKSDVTIDYTIQLTAKVLVIKVNIPISSSATFPCPLDVNIFLSFFSISFHNKNSKSIFFHSVFRAALYLGLQMEQWLMLYLVKEKEEDREK